jgi:hypothetical protein
MPDKANNPALVSNISTIAHNLLSIIVLRSDRPKKFAS